MPPSKMQPGSPSSDSSHSISDDITVTQESSVNNQGLAFNSVSDLNLVEMTEVEYTNLQQILYSQMEAQAAEQGGSVDTRLDSTSTLSLPAIQAVFQSVPPQDFAEYEARTPSIPVNQTENSPSSDLQFVTTNLNHQGQVDYQEFKMILMSDPVGNTQVIEKTPTSCGEVPGPVLAKIRNATGAVGDRRVDPGELRPSPAARVRLEKRFSCSPCDVSRLQYTNEQSATLNNFLSMLHHPTDLFGLSMQSGPSKYIKVGGSKLASSGPPVNGGNSCHSSSISQAQNLGTISHILESGKHQDLIIPNNFSFSYQQDTEPIKAAFCTQTKPVMEPEVWIKLDEETVRKPVPPSKRVRGRQMCPERHALNDIQNSVAGQGVPNTRRSTLKAGVVGESLQRRERHNSMERDRRRRIRICCDELNMLVPFCNPETDKATTLQWTTAFLKYIKEVHGDSLRKEFQSAFCGKTGKRIKLVHSSSDQTTTYGEPLSLPATQSAEFKGS